MAAQDLRARLEAAVKLPAADGSDVLDPLRAAAGNIFPDILQRLQSDDVVSITRAVLLTDARTKIKDDQIIEAFKSIKRQRFANVVECVAFEASFANGGRKVGTPEVNRGVNAKLLLSSRSNLSSGTKEAGATKLAACRTIQSEAAGYVLENGGHFSANAASEPSKLRQCLEGSASDSSDEDVRPSQPHLPAHVLNQSDPLQLSRWTGGGSYERIADDLQCDSAFTARIQKSATHARKPASAKPVRKPRATPVKKPPVRPGLSR